MAIESQELVDAPKTELEQKEDKFFKRFKIGLSSDTVETLTELETAMGISRDALIEGLILTAKEAGFDVLYPAALAGIKHRTQNLSTFVSEAFPS